MAQGRKLLAGVKRKPNGKINYGNKYSGVGVVQAVGPFGQQSHTGTDVFGKRTEREKRVGAAKAALYLRIVEQVGEKGLLEYLALPELRREDAVVSLGLRCEMQALKNALTHD